MKDTEVTGVMVQYYKVCTRELWYYIHQINMNYNNDDIEIGKLIHENSYKREKKEIRAGIIVFDFVQTKDKVQIFEIKKSSKLPIGALYQLYYYLYILEKEKINAEGILLFPKERQRETIELNDEIREEMKEIIKNIEKIANNETPPQSRQKPYCKRCSFQELCMI